MTTPTVISFFVPGDPKGQPRPRAFAKRWGPGVNDVSARCYDPGTAEGWKSQIADAARKGHLLTKPLLGPVRLSLLFTMRRIGSHYKKSGEVKPGAPLYHRVKPDDDNLIKGTQDALTHLGFWRDDAQVAELEFSKCYGDTAGCRITIVELVERPKQEG